MHVASKLISTKRGTVFVAAAAALLAGILILVYLNGYRSSVKAEGAPVTVLIARTDIPKGTSGTVIAQQGLFKTTTMRESQLREGAFSDPSSLKGRVTTQEIYKGSQLTSAALAPGAKTLATTLTAKERILGVPLDSAHGLIGEIEAASHVDVYALFKVVQLRADGTPIAGAQSRSVLKRIITDVPVIDISSQSGGLGSQTTKVLLKMNDSEAQKLAFSSDEGKVWLSLRPNTGAESTPPSLVSIETVLGLLSPVTVYRSFRGH